LENLDPEFIILTKHAKKHLFAIAKWAKNISVIGFITILFLVVAFLYSLGFSGYSNSINTKQLISFLASLFFISLYVYSIYKLYNFSKYCKKAMKENDSIMFELSLHNLKQNFKIIGIITLIITAVFLVLFAAITIGGSMAHKFY
jgi:hypothetical protein